MRMSNNNQPNFTDEELITVYIFGILNKQFEIKGIYNYIKDYWLEWFPFLPSYQAFNNRLNRLEDVFPKLLESILKEISSNPDIRQHIGLLDSFPIMLAKSPRCDKAKVGREEGVANKGYCSSKDIYYHGVKIHIFATKAQETLPIPKYIGLTPGGESDLKAVEMSILPLCVNMDIYADKAYFKEVLVRELKEKQNVSLYTPIKKEKGQERLNSADKLFSEAVSRMRQPIESLFNWIQEKTHIQFASKVRSTKGIFIHVFGRLAAAMLILVLGL